jgi:hypothetical protein
MKTKHFLISILFAAILPGCKKDSVPNISCNEKSNSFVDVKKIFPGTYTWAYSVVTYLGSSSHIESPTTTGITYKYVFGKDGKAYYYENSILKSTYNYKIDYEFKVTSFPGDSATIIIISDSETGQRKQFFRPYLCSDSALFYNPFNSIDTRRYFVRD